MCGDKFLDDPAAIEHLAKELCWKMWALDPQGDESQWDSLDDFERETYRQCVKWILIQMGSVGGLTPGNKGPTSA
jgi:hypothetical protein